jgi:hypothetical protein
LVLMSGKCDTSTHAGVVALIDVML